MISLREQIFFSARQQKKGTNTRAVLVCLHSFRFLALQINTFPFLQWHANRLLSFCHISHFPLSWHAARTQTNSKVQQQCTLYINAFLSPRCVWVLVFCHLQTNKNCICCITNVAACALQMVGVIVPLKVLHLQYKFHCHTWIKERRHAFKKRHTSTTGIPIVFCLPISITITITLVEVA